MRTLTLALIALVVLHVTNATNPPGLAGILLRAIGFGSFVPCALSMASAITGNHALLLATAVMSALAVLPGSMANLALALTPIGAGVLLGCLIQRAMREPQEPPHA